MIGVNVGVPVPREPFSFGGWNESKFGVGDITGKSSIEFWTKLKKSHSEMESGGGGELDELARPPAPCPPLGELRLRSTLLVWKYFKDEVEDM